MERKKIRFSKQMKELLVFLVIHRIFGEKMLDDDERFWYFNLNKKGREKFYHYNKIKYNKDVEKEKKALRILNFGFGDVKKLLNPKNSRYKEVSIRRCARTLENLDLVTIEYLKPSKELFRHPVLDVVPTEKGIKVAMRIYNDKKSYKQVIVPIFEKIKIKNEERKSINLKNIKKP